MMKRNNRLILLYLLALSFFTFSCNNDDSIKSISIDPNNVSIEDLYGTWEVISFSQTNDNYIKTGEYNNHYLGSKNVPCEEKSNSYGIVNEWVIGFLENKRVYKIDFDYAFYSYNDGNSQPDSTYGEVYSNCDISGKELEEEKNNLSYSSESISKTRVVNNQIYFEVYNEGGRYAEKFKIEVTENKIQLYKEGNNSETLSDDDDFELFEYELLAEIIKTSNSVDIDEFNKGHNTTYIDGEISY